MKKHYILKVVIALVFLGFGERSWGQLVYEPFDYASHPTNGVYLQSGSTWSNANTGDSILIATGSLFYNGLLSNGNRVVFGGAGSDAGRTFGAQTSGTVYMSFMLNVTSIVSLNNTGTYFSGLGLSITTNGTCVWLRKSTLDATKYNIGVSTRSNSSTTWLPTEYPVNVSHLVVCAYQIISGANNDIGKIWVNPALGNSTEAISDGLADPATTDLSSIGAIFLRQDANSTTPSIEMDEIRVGTTWASVTPQQIFYPKTGATNLAALDNWTSDVNGGVGTMPADFSNLNQLFSINRDGGVTGTLTLAGSDALISGASVVTVSPSGRINISAAASDFDLNGHSLVFKSDATNTASIGTIVGTLTDATNITVERYIPTAKRAWRLLTSPVNGPTINAAWQEGRTPIASAAAASGEPTTYGTLITGGSTYPDAASSNAQGYDYIGSTGTPSIRIYTPNGNSGNWNSSLATSNPLNTHQAYMLFVRGDRTVTSGSGTTTLRATGTYKTGAAVPIGTTNQYTLVGNPYPSNIDFESVYQTNLNEIQHRFWIWDATAGSFGAYKLINWNSGTGAGAIYEAIPAPYTSGTGTPSTDLKTIQSGQGFFVEYANSGGTLDIVESHKTITNTSTQIFRVGTGIAEKLNINLNLLETDNTAFLADGVQAKYDAGYSTAFSSEDIEKPNNFNENIAIHRSGKYLILEGRPQISGADTTFLTMWNLTERNYQIQLKAENFNTPGITASLVDKFTGITTPVNLNGEITTLNFLVNADPNSKMLDRFKVVYRMNSTLPVKFTNIKASEKNAKVEVEWTVFNEAGTKNYEIEKSSNGQLFKTVTTVAATGKSTYNWTDNSPLSGKNYYRIKGISEDGSLNFTSIATVNLSKGISGIAVYPNPISGKTFALQISNKDKADFTLRITNSTGQIVYKQIISHNGGSATHTIELDKRIEKGIYQLELSGNDGTKELTRIIKN